MVKLIEYCVKFITVVIAALLMSSCKHSIDFGENTISGSGNKVTEERTVDPFTSVKVSSGLDCEVVQANTQKVTVEADDNVIKGIKTYVENGTLIIDSKFSNYINVSSKKIRVEVPLIAGLETTSGSSLVTKNTLKGTNITLKSSSGSDLNASIEYENVTAKTSSGSEQNLSGKALKLSTETSSGSEINAENLIANDVTSKSSSGSSTNVHPLVNLTAKASSGSSIDYEGNPKNIEKDESSGGSVDKN